MHLRISQFCGGDQVDCGRSGETDVIQRLGGNVRERVGQRALLPARGSGCVPTCRGGCWHRNYE